MRTQYRIQNETEIRKNQSVLKNDNNELIVKNYPKIKKPIIEKLKINLPNCPRCKRINWIKVTRRYFCRTSESLYGIIKQKYQTDKKVLRQDIYFSTRLP